MEMAMEMQSEMAAFLVFENLAIFNILLAIFS